MKVIQISRTQGRDCGIALLADTLQERLRHAGIAVETVVDLPAGAAADVFLLHHHDELIADAEVEAMASASSVPFVLFAHAHGVARLQKAVDAFVAMSPGMVGPTSRPSYVFPHPAWTPLALEDRGTLRQEFELPPDRKIVGTHGFLKFERRFPEIVEALIGHAERNNWFVELVVSPWRLESPGLIETLERIRSAHSSVFRFEYGFLDAPVLNRRLQACDLLWCWTDAPSAPYASGVVSDQYASGTRIFAADKLQHAHVVGLENVETGSDRLDGFIDGLVQEMVKGSSARHDPAPVSWGNFIYEVAGFLHRVAGRA